MIFLLIFTLPHGIPRPMYAPICANINIKHVDEMKHGRVTKKQGRLCDRASAIGETIYLSLSLPRHLSAPWSSGERISFCESFVSPRFNSQH